MNSCQKWSLEPERSKIILHPTPCPRYVGLAFHKCGRECSMSPCQKCHLELDKSKIILHTHLLCVLSLGKCCGGNSASTRYNCNLELERSKVIRHPTPCSSCVFCLSTSDVERDPWDRVKDAALVWKSAKSSCILHHSCLLNFAAWTNVVEGARWVHVNKHTLEPWRIEIILHPTPYPFCLGFTFGGASIGSPCQKYDLEMNMSKIILHPTPFSSLNFAFWTSDVERAWRVVSIKTTSEPQTVEIILHPAPCPFCLDFYILWREHWEPLSKMRLGDEYGQNHPPSYTIPILYVLSFTNSESSWMSNTSLNFYFDTSRPSVSSCHKCNLELERNKIVCHNHTVCLCFLSRDKCCRESSESTCQEHSLELILVTSILHPTLLAHKCLFCPCTSRVRKSSASIVKNATWSPKGAKSSDILHFALSCVIHFRIYAMNQIIPPPCRKISSGLDCRWWIKSAMQTCRPMLLNSLRPKLFRQHKQVKFGTSKLWMVDDECFAGLETHSFVSTRA